MISRITSVIWVSSELGPTSSILRGPIRSKRRSCTRPLSDSSSDGGPAGAALREEPPASIKDGSSDAGCARYCKRSINPIVFPPCRTQSMQQPAQQAARLRRFFGACAIQLARQSFQLLAHNRAAADFPQIRPGYLLFGKRLVLARQPNIDRLRQRPLNSLLGDRTGRVITVKYETRLHFGYAEPLIKRQKTLRRPD